MGGEKLNYIKELAQIFDLELDEEFALLTTYGASYGYKFTKDGLIHYYNYQHLECCEKDVISDMLHGKLRVMKKPWLPKMGESYYYISSVRCHDKDSYYVMDEAWEDTSFDYERFSIDNCFKTREKAEKAIPWYIDNIEQTKNGKEWRERYFKWRTI